MDDYEICKYRGLEVHYDFQEEDGGVILVAVFANGMDIIYLIHDIVYMDIERACVEDVMKARYNSEYDRADLRDQSNKESS